MATSGKGKSAEGNTPTVTRAEVIACNTSAQLARLFASLEFIPPALAVRLLNKSGIVVRTRVRKGLGDLPAVFVSKGDVLTDAHKVALAESFGITVTK